MEFALKETTVSGLFLITSITGINLLSYTNMANAEMPTVTQILEERIIAADHHSNHDDDDDDDEPDENEVEAEATSAVESLSASLSPHEAVAIALTVATGKVEDIELEPESGRFVYEVGLSTGEVLIDAQTGDVLTLETDDGDEIDDADENETEAEAISALASLSASLSPNEAVEIALTVTTGEIQEIELDYKANQFVYEIYLTTGEVWVDAQGGEVLTTEFPFMPNFVSFLQYL